MVGSIAIRWVARGVLTDRGHVVAHPGEIVYVDSFTAEKHVSAGNAEYVRR